MRDGMRYDDDLQDALASRITKRFANEPPQQQAKHREIARRYRRKRRRGAKHYVRLVELRRVFVDRYGPVMPDNDAGRDAVFVVANHLAHREQPERSLRLWLRVAAPWMHETETADLIETVLPSPTKWTADKLAERIDLDFATRTRLGVTTIGATDCKKAKRARLRKKRDAARHRALRVKAGARPRAASAAQTKPWVILGKTERTYYRHRSVGSDGSKSSAAYPTDIEVETKQCQGAPPPQGGTSARAVIDRDDRVFMLPREAQLPLTSSSSM